MKPESQLKLEDVIDRCLGAIRVQFYEQHPARDFNRDYGYLKKAISRYGHQCEERGWELDEFTVLQNVLGLLRKLKAPDHQYLPTYLEACIDRHVGQRAEAIQEQHRALAPRLQRLRDESAKSVNRDISAEAAATVRLAQLHKDLAEKARRKRLEARKEKTEPKQIQPTLFNL